VRGRVAAVERVPYDPVARIDGFGAPARLADETLAAGRRLARALIASRQAPAAPPVEEPGTPSKPADAAAGPPAAAATPATPPFPTTSFPTAGALAAMSANTGWVPVRPEPAEDESTDDDL